MVAGWVLMMSMCAFWCFAVGRWIDCGSCAWAPVAGSNGGVVPGRAHPVAAAACCAAPTPVL